MKQSHLISLLVTLSLGIGVFTNAASAETTVPDIPSICSGKTGAYSPHGAAATKYTGSAYKPINTYLRTGAIPEGSLFNEQSVKQYVKMLDELTARGYTGPTEFYRVENISAGRIQQFKFDRAFTSTSRDAGWAHELMRASTGPYGTGKPRLLNLIEAPYGAHGLDINAYLGANSPNSAEVEFLLPRNTYMRRVGPIEPYPDAFPGSMQTRWRYIPEAKPSSSFLTPNDGGMLLDDALRGGAAAEGSALARGCGGTLRMGGRALGVAGTVYAGVETWHDWSDRTVRTAESWGGHPGDPLYIYDGSTASILWKAPAITALGVRDLGISGVKVIVVDPAKFIGKALWEGSRIDAEHQFEQRRWRFTP